MPRTIFSLSVVCAALSLSASTLAQVAAQPAPTPASPAATSKDSTRIRPRERLKIANDVLAKMTLTPKQRTQVSDVETKLKAQVDKIRAQAKADPNKSDKPAYRQKILDLDKTFHQDLMDILTPPQRKEFRNQMRAGLAKLAKEKQAGLTGGK